MGLTYYINICICFACLVIPPWQSLGQFIFPVFWDNLPIYGLLFLSARKPHPQSMASLIVTCAVVCCDALLQFILTTATEDGNLHIVTLEVFEKVKWIIFSIGFVWVLMVVDRAIYITKTFVMTLPLFTTIVIFIFCQGAILATQNLQTLRSVLKVTLLAPLPNSSHNLTFQGHTIDFRSNDRDIKVWVSQSPGLIPVAPIKQKSGAQEYHLPRGNVLVYPPWVKITAKPIKQKQP